MSDIQSTINNEQIPKKTVSKSRTKKKYRKINSEKKKQEAQKNEIQTVTNGSKSLEDCRNSENEISNGEISMDKKNVNSTKILSRHNKTHQIKNKAKINSPNHKLTEYFSELNVDECANTKSDIKLEGSETSFKIKENSKQLSNVSQERTQTILQKHKVKSNFEITNHKVTEYFHVRRSERKYKKSILFEEQKNLENKILNQVEDGLKIQDIKGKGRGIVTTKEFFRGDFVIEYIGDFIDVNIANEREEQYSKNNNIGCYMYYFKHKNKKYCIDATEETGKLGRLINHSRKGNLTSRIIEIDQMPHLVLFAKTDISIGTELLYDYGDRSKESVRNHPWLTL